MYTNLLITTYMFTKRLGFERLKLKSSSLKDVEDGWVFPFLQVFTQSSYTFERPYIKLE